MKTLNKFLIALTLLALTALLYSCSDSPSSSEASVVPEIAITNLSSSQLLSGEIKLNINTSSPSHFKEIKLFLRDEEIQSIEPNTNSIELTTWDFENGQAELKVEGITTDDESITSTYNVEFENYVFQWETDGVIDRKKNFETITKSVLIITDHEGNMIEDFDILEKREGLLQFLAPEDINFDLPESIAINIVDYYEFTSGGVMTIVNTYANVLPGTIVDQNTLSEKNIGEGLNNSFELEEPQNFELSSSEHEYTTQEERDVFFEINEIDAQESLWISVRTEGGGSGFSVNSESYGTDITYEGENAMIVYAYPEDLNSNTTPKYWIIEDVADTVRVNYQENDTPLSTKEIKANPNYEWISPSARVNYENTSFLTVSGWSEEKMNLYYPSELKIDWSRYMMRKTNRGQVHSKTVYDKIFKEVDDPITANFNIEEASNYRITVSQNGTYDIYQLSGWHESNRWILTSSQNENTIILPNIDRYIDSNHSGFDARRFDFNTFFFVEFEEFDESQPYLNYQFINRARVNHKTKSYLY